MKRSLEKLTRKVNTMRKLILIAFTSLTTMILVGCGPRQAREDKPIVRNSSYLDKYEDKENGVICYRGSSETLSCVKVK